MPGKLTATVYDLDGSRLPQFQAVDRVAYVNHESFGKSENIGNVLAGGGQTVLVLNVNGFSAALFENA